LNAIRDGVIAISIVDLMTSNAVQRVALSFGIIVTKFDLREIVRAWISAFWWWYVMSRCDLDLWPVDLESSWYVKRHVVKVCTKFERNRAQSLAELLIILRIFGRVMSCCDLDLWRLNLELLQYFGCHAFNFVQNL